MSTNGKQMNGGAAHRVFRGYGPLLGFIVVFLLMALLVPTSDRQVVTRAIGAGAAGNDNSGAVGADTGGGGVSGTGGAGGVAGAGTAKSLPPGVKGGCPDRAKQVQGDGYSPPCISFSGNNGGATAKGVTGDSIIVSARLTNDPGFQQALAQVAGAQISDTPDDVKRTLLVLADYFNKNFQFYGRKIVIKFFNGKGSSTTELLGGGQEEASADAITASQEVKAFAEINGSTEPYADALARDKVIAFGAPYLSREWMSQRAPYTWSIATDCSIVTESVAEYALKVLAHKPAIYAGDQYKTTTRKIAALAPENPWYQECVDAGAKVAAQGGNPLADRIAYQLDLGSMSNQAANVIAKLKSEGITTVLCGCDPVFPIFLTQKAAEQGYTPEWLVTGTALTDQDLVGQLYDQSQWQHAFGISYLGSPQQLRASSGYFAYKSMRSDEPAFAVDIIYYQMYMLALGIQLAGPNLTPQTFEQGMFSYPGGTGPAGTWGFGPGHFTPTQDFREIYWDPTKTSTQNQKQGAYIEPNPGVRYKPGHVPPHDPVAFTG